MSSLKPGHEQAADVIHDRQPLLLRAQQPQTQEAPLRPGIVPYTSNFSSLRVVELQEQAIPHK